ncbi:cation:dicarboxylate symporter family transporter [Actinoalloteichus hoggarensis]|uniref:cation:dicarboxylate symporter family transporter n=1 Tax=Actinoalloteichus hoggarensis TaxID=1470176 RepID=UPI001C88B7B6
MGVDRRYADFAVPLGVTTKMDGCAAIHPAIATIFIAQVYGVPLSLGDHVPITLVPAVGARSAVESPAAPTTRRSRHRRGSR